jgi:hypothetical protein
MVTAYTGMNDEISATVIANLAKEMDFRVLTKMLCSQGWKQCNSAKDHEQADIEKWAEQYCIGKIKGLGNSWVIHNEKDYIMFLLKWC